jgi:hypothetical protein
VTAASGFEPPMESYWHRMISEAAYYLAEQRDFKSGRAIDDWLLAEAHIKEVLAGSARAVSSAPDFTHPA